MKPDKRNNNNPNGGGNNNRRNAFGLVSIVLWALFLTLLFRGCMSSYEKAGTVTVPYTTFKEWLAEGKIYRANVESSQITFTLKEGVEVELPQDEGQKEESQTQQLMESLMPTRQQDAGEPTQYVTIRLASVTDYELQSLLDEQLNGEEGSYAFTEPVQKITIVPHTEGSLGYTLLMPEEDKTNLRTKEELMAQITVSMGGRAAEEVVMHTMTNGASQDIQEATNIARNMVAMFGMSDEFGMMALGSIRNQYLDGGYGLDCAQETAAIMDKEVKVILDQCYKDAVALIRDNLEDMHKVVAYLLEKETITGGEMVAIIEGRDPALVEDAYASTRQSEKKKPLPGDIEPPAKNIHIVSEEIKPPVPLGDGEEHAPDGSQPEGGQPAVEEQPDEGQPEPDAAEENVPPTAEDAPRPEDGQLSDEDESKE